MLLNVLSRGVVLTDSMRAAMQRKLDFALDRFGDRLERVEVTIEDLNGPRGGVDKRVRLLLSGPVSRSVVIDERGDNVMAALSSAVHRASQVLGRMMERRNRLAHRSQ
jgi:putative sigma-54 modulation protein